MYVVTLVYADGVQSCTLPCQLQVPTGKAQLIAYGYHQEEIDLGDHDGALDVGYGVGGNRRLPSAHGFTLAALAVGGVTSVIVGAAPPGTAPLERIGGAACALGFGSMALIAWTTPKELQLTPIIAPTAGGATLGVAGSF